MKTPVPSELILTPEGSIYHLRLKPDEVADTIILVGDPERVSVVSSFFDKIELKRQNREINTHTGYLNNKRISVISTGMGPDNIDIIINELDALFNINLNSGLPKEERTSMNIVRIGTSGAIQDDIPVDSLVASSHGIGIDGLIYFYKGAEKIIDQKLNKAFLDYIDWIEKLATPYIVPGSNDLLAKIGEGMYKGITITSPGFYGPQGRSLRLPLANPELNRKLAGFRYENARIINYEMETAALYGIGGLLNHNAATACVILANRATGEYTSNYEVTIRKLIAMVLERLTG